LTAKDATNAHFDVEENDRTGGWLEGLPLKTPDPKRFGAPEKAASMVSPIGEAVTQCVSALR
jgi:hypothetical protein